MQNHLTTVFRSCAPPGSVGKSKLKAYTAIFQQSSFTKIQATLTVSSCKSDITFLCGCSASFVNPVQHIILCSVACYGPGRLASAELLQLQLLCYINHILQKFANFARSPSNIEFREGQVTYAVPSSWKKEDIHLILFPFSVRNEVFKNLQMVKLQKKNQCSTTVKKFGVI